MSTTKKTNATRTKSKLETLLTAMLAGMQSALPATVKSMVLDGVANTPTQVDQSIQKGLDAFANVRTAKAAYLAAVASSKTIEAESRALAHAIEAWLKVQFGSTNATMLAKFGVTLPAPKQTSVGAKALGQAKSAATRQKKKAAAALEAAAATPIVVSPAGVQIAAPVPPK